MAKKNKEDLNESAHRVFQEFLKISEEEQSVKTKKNQSVKYPPKKDK